MFLPVHMRLTRILEIESMMPATLNLKVGYPKWRFVPLDMIQHIGTMHKFFYTISMCFANAKSDKKINSVFSENWLICSLLDASIVKYIEMI